MGVAHTTQDDIVVAASGAHILVVDDDGDARAALVRLLRAEGFTTSTAANGEAALAEVVRARPDIVLTDLQMPVIDGVELCRRLHAIDGDLPVIVMTAHSDVGSVVESLRERAEDYLIKPLESAAVLWSVERAIARRAEKRAHQEVQRMLNERLVLSSIREQDQAEAAARHAAQLKALLENLSDGVLLAHPRHEAPIVINEAARNILGLERDERHTSDTFASLEVRDLANRPLPNEQRPLARALRGEQFVDYEVQRVRPNGERRRIVSTGTSVKDEKGEVALAIVVFRDVTEQRRLETQRDEYLSLISHDLRGPLSVVLMSLEMLKEDMRPDVVERTERNARRMQVMLDELRDATSLEGPGVELQRAPCDLRQLVANAIDGIDDARAKRVSVEIDTASAWLVFADASRLERVVTNLITNALKYSAEDKAVTLRFARKDGAIELAVVDHGIGIAPESVKRVFDRYYRAPMGKLRASGLGLGLYIARLIVDLHGGHIEVESDLGKGSTFRLVLPSLAA